VKKIEFLFAIILTILGADSTLFLPISERAITAKTLQLKRAMQKRGTKDLQLVSMMNAEELLALYKEDKPYITLTIPQSGHSYRFKINQINSVNNQKATLHAVNEKGVSQGRLTLSFRREIGIGTLTLPEGTFVLYVYKSKGWLGKKRQKKMIDEKGIVSPGQSKRKLISGTGQSHLIKSRTLQNLSPYEIKWMVYLSRTLANTFLSKEELELSLDNFTEDINQIYAESHINAFLNLVHYEIIDMDDPACSETVLKTMWNGEAPHFQNLDALQHQYRADIVSVLVNDFNFWGGLGYKNRCHGYAKEGTCGWWEGPNYNTCMYDTETVSHEIGHNMGLGHSYAQGEEGTEFFFGRGHGVDGAFATIMAYPDAYNVWRNIPLFSNPVNTNCNHLPCGVPHTRDDAADAVYAINAILPCFSEILTDGDGTESIENVDNVSVRNCYLESAKLQSANHNDYTVQYLSQLQNIECQEINASDMYISLSHLSLLVLTDGNLSGIITFSNMPKLSWLDLHNNDITRVKITGSSNIEGVFLSENNITGTLDLSEQYHLRWVGVDNNQITHLVLPENNRIESLNISSNPLSILNIENLRNIDELYAYNTPLECWQERVLLSENNISQINAFCRDNMADSLDTDGDGIANIDDMDDDGDGLHDLEDDDIDGDGVVNIYDQFMIDKNQSGDFDGDGLVNELDMDDDNDGVDDSQDAFPFNPDESQDSDGDGIGDNSDEDADGDGKKDKLALKIEALYVAYYYRAGDQSGLDYWYSAITEGDKTLADLSKGFSLHPKFAEEYSGLDNRAFVTKVYINMLGNAPDEGGLHYWVDLLDTGVQKNDFIAMFISAVFDTDLTKMLNEGLLTQQEYDDAFKRKNILYHKSMVALAFVNQLKEATNITMPDDLNHDPAYCASIKIISEVTDDENSMQCVRVFLENLTDENGLDSIAKINDTNISELCR